MTISRHTGPSEGRRLLLGAMARSGLTQADLQRRLDVDASTTSKWVSADRTPHWKYRIGIAEIFPDVAPSSWDEPANDASIDDTGPRAKVTVDPEMDREPSGDTPVPSRSPSTPPPASMSAIDAVNAATAQATGTDDGARQFTGIATAPTQPGLVGNRKPSS